jgi:hypothetical protein
VLVVVLSGVHLQKAANKKMKKIERKVQLLCMNEEPVLADIPSS